MFQVPDGTIDLIISNNMTEPSIGDTFINVALNNLPKHVSCATKEYFCYKAYLVS